MRVLTAARTTTLGNIFLKTARFLCDLIQLHLSFIFARIVDIACLEAPWCKARNANDCMIVFTSEYLRNMNFYEIFMQQSSIHVFFESTSLRSAALRCVTNFFPLLFLFLRYCSVPPQWRCT